MHYHVIMHANNHAWLGTGRTYWVYWAYCLGDACYFANINMLTDRYVRDYGITVAKIGL